MKTYLNFDEAIKMEMCLYWLIHGKQYWTMNSETNERRFRVNFVEIETNKIKAWEN